MTPPHLADERPLRQKHGQPHFVLLQTAALRLLHVSAGIFYRSPGWDDSAEDLLKPSNHEREANSTEQSDRSFQLQILHKTHFTRWKDPLRELVDLETLRGVERGGHGRFYYCE